MIIDKLNSALNKTDIIFSKYVYIYSDFRAFLNQAGRNPEKKVLKFLNLLNQPITNSYLKTIDKKSIKNEYFYNLSVIFN